MKQKQKQMRIDFVARLAAAAILWHSSAGVPSISVPRQDAADVTDGKADWRKLFSIGRKVEEANIAEECERSRCAGCQWQVWFGLVWFGTLEESRASQHS